MQFDQRDVIVYIAFSVQLLKTYQKYIAKDRILPGNTVRWQLQKIAIITDQDGQNSFIYNTLDTLCILGLDQGRNNI